MNEHAKCRLQPHHFEVISSANSGSACGKNGRTCVACRFFLWSFGNIMLMKELPKNHLGCIKHCKRWDIYHINWLGRISSINRSLSMFLVLSLPQVDLAGPDLLSFCTSRRSANSAGGASTLSMSCLPRGMVSWSIECSLHPQCHQNFEKRIQALVGKVLRRNPWPSPNTEEDPCPSFIYSWCGHLAPMSSCPRQDHAKSA